MITKSSYRPLPHPENSPGLTLHQPSPPATYCSDTYYYRLVLPALEFPTHGIVQYIPLCLASLVNTILLKFIHVSV